MAVIADEVKVFASTLEVRTFVDAEKSPVTVICEGGVVDGVGEGRERVWAGKRLAFPAEALGHEGPVFARKSFPEQPKAVVSAAHHSKVPFRMGSRIYSEGKAPFAACRVTIQHDFSLCKKGHNEGLPRGSPHAKFSCLSGYRKVIFPDEAVIPRKAE
jgi:hypothetical protein